MFFGANFFAGGFFDSSQVAPVQSGGPGGLITFLAWRAPTEAQVEKVKLERKLKAQKAELKKVERKIVAAEKRAAKAEKPEGVLANLDRLTLKAAELRKNIELTAVDLAAVYDFLSGLDFDSDEDDIEALLLNL